MNATLEATKDAVQFVEAQEFPTHTTARNVHKWKKIEMDVQKLLTLVLRRLIFSTSGKNMDSKNAD
jgi:hypothetical protein